MQNQSVFKSLLIGDQGVGKSSFLYQFTKNEYKSQYVSTVGLEFGSKDIEISPNKTAIFQIWDTAGQETFKSIIRSFYRNAACVFVLYSIDRQESFDNVDEWVNEAREHSHDNIIIILLGSKVDLDSERVVSQEKAREKKINLNLDLFFEISSKERTHIDELIQQTISLIQERMKIKEYQQQIQQRNDSLNLSLQDQNQEVKKSQLSDISNHQMQKKSNRGCC